MKHVRFFVGVALVVSSACARDSVRLFEPSPPIDVADRTVSGTLWLHQSSGVTRASSGSVFGWIQRQAAGGVRVAPVGPDGRFSFGAARDSIVYITSGFHQPCVAFAEVQGDVTIDVHGVVGADMLGANFPASLGSSQPTLSGIVYSQTSQGRSPVSNVAIQLAMDLGDGPALAVTRTDEQGRYTLCHLPPLQDMAVLASHVEYYSASRPVPAAATQLDIELRASDFSFQR